MRPKVICDPIHGHIHINREEEKLILDLIECREIQRLRRIRQLGVSYFTYPGAEHSRFSHAIGTFHFMKVILENIKKYESDHVKLDDRTYLGALAAALLHDVGHGPFSHLLEHKFSGSHEKWTEDIINSSDTEINSVLGSIDSSFPDLVAKLISTPPKDLYWVNSLLSSQIDVDRMDYLLRDSHFCGIAYGHFDYSWIFHTIRIRIVPHSGLLQPVWIKKALRAIEEYIFARYNMYWAVYYHKTTRGYEVLLNSIFKRARYLHENVKSLELISNSIEKLVSGKNGTLSVKEYLDIDDTNIFAQIIMWIHSDDLILKDLCSRFINRKGFKAIDYRENEIQLHEDRKKAHKQIEELFKKNNLDPKYHLLESASSSKAYDCYRAEREDEEMTAKNSILLLDDKEKLCEISRFPNMERLKTMTDREEILRLYFVPEDVRVSVNKIFDDFTTIN